jgi:lipid-A-disaccharide synthase
MPGSRRGEIRRLLGIFGEALRLAEAVVPGLRPVLPIAGQVEALVREGTAGWPVRPILVRSQEEKHDAYAAVAQSGGAGLIKSGTSSLEMAVAGIPHVVGYKANPITATIVRRLIKVPYVSLVNLLAERELAPERLQQDCTPAALSAVLVRLLTDPVAAAAQREGFAAVRALLRAPEGLPSEAAAAAVLAELRLARGAAEPAVA